jgi:hypothetical protein
MRVIVSHVLTQRCGWTDAEARERGKNVSHFYDNHIRATKAPKDDKGLAVYDESDVPGLIQAAQNIKDGHGRGSAYDKPTTFKGTTMADMGF